MYLDTEDRGISRTLLLFGDREADHKLIFEKAIREGMTVLDLGANIGYYVMMERNLVGRMGHIIAVEPVPSNVKLLKRNVELNNIENIQILQMAGAGSDGTATMYMTKTSNHHTFHRKDAGFLSGETIEVETMTVPSLMKKYGKADLMRMDIQGHEVEVMNGMVESIERGEIEPMIVFEVHRRFYGPDNDMDAALRRFFANGYHGRYVGSSTESGTKIVESMGYKGGPELRSDFITRKVFENIEDEHLIDLVCHCGGVRTVLLAKRETA
jgi:FkbM family methyltransferase